MTNLIELLLLVTLGVIVGYGIEKIMEWMKNSNIPILGISLLQFSAEVLYFTSILCAPISGNLPMSFIVLAIFLYALYGGFGAEKVLKPQKPEDKVDSKWFPKYP